MIIVFLFFCFALLFAICWISFLISFGIAKWREESEAARTSGKILAWLSGAAVLVVAFLWFVLSPPAATVYHNEFGENPTADVKELRCSTVGGTDSQEIMLRFQAAPSTFRRLAKIRKLRWVPSIQRNPGDLADPDAPEWWNPNISANSQLYELGRRNASFANEKTTLFYDPKTQTAYYWFFGVD